MPDTLARAARERGSDVWLQFTDGDTYTFGEIEDWVERVSAGLAALGVKRGDRVALMLENTPEFVATWFATLRLGALAVPINCGAKGGLLEHYLRLPGPEVAVVAEAFVPQVSSALRAIASQSKLVVAGTSPPAGAIRFTELLEAESSDAPALRLADPAVIMFTSGTTGPSKGILFSHHFLANFAHLAVRTFGFRREDMIYSVLPFFHANALILMTCGSLLVGAKATIARRFSLSGFWDDAIACGGTVTSMLGSMAALLFQQPPSAKDRGHKITRSMLVPAPAEYYEIMTGRFGIVPLDMYGQSDAGILISPCYGEEVKPGSCGRVLDGYECRLVDENDEEVPRGTPGECIVRPLWPGMISDGYWAMPEKTVEAWRGLWLRTGDLLRQDEDGWYYYVDRKKDAIRRRGENISSFEVEQPFRSHPGVEDVAAYPIRSELTEDDVAIAVVAKHGIALEPLDLVHFAEDKLPYYCLPRYVTFMPALPMTPTHKVRKDALVKLGVTATTWDRQSSSYRPPR
jgi:crotonobetaine/carnitine-CoA ligase